MATEILTNQTTNTETDWMSLTAGVYSLLTKGAFDDDTLIELHFSHDDAIDFPDPKSNVTQPGVTMIVIPDDGLSLKLKLIESGSTTDVTAVLA